MSKGLKLLEEETKLEREAFFKKKKELSSVYTYFSRGYVDFLMIYNNVFNYNVLDLNIAWGALSSAFLSLQKRNRKPVIAMVVFDQKF